MFVIKYDKLSMVKLVQCIEKYPCIYNTKQHFSFEETNAAWDKIALEVGEKDSLCRDRWHSIKSCYIRHLKFASCGSLRRPYYLAEHLEFFKPYVYDKVVKYMLEKGHTSNLPSYLKECIPKDAQSQQICIPTVGSLNGGSVSEEGPSVVKTETVDVDEESQLSWVNGGAEEEDPLGRPSSSKQVKRKNGIQYGKVKKKTAKSKLENDEDDDTIFFKKLLPDVARMSSHQKLKFKQEALSIIEDILYATNDMFVAEDVKVSIGSEVIEDIDVMDVSLKEDPDTTEDVNVTD